MVKKNKETVKTLKIILLINGYSLSNLTKGQLTNTKSPKDSYIEVLVLFAFGFLETSCGKF